MKIKEVISQTKLTDKAIRLYIDNGLVAPSIDESYSGRKSIDFSAEDVERLNNIALLRKAGFSIADIKEIIESDEKAQCVVERFIEETEKNIRHETEIVEKLRNIPAENGISMETICDSLSKTVEKKQVPKEDLSTSLWNKIEKNLYKSIGIIGILITVAIYIFTAVYWCSEYIHLKLVDGWFSWTALLYAGWIAITIFSIILILLNRNKSKFRKKKVCRALSLIITVFMFICGWLALFPTLLGGISPPAYSTTSDINDYLILDSWVNKNFGDEIYSLFPEKIPDYALKGDNPDRYYDDGAPLSTKYYYKLVYNFDQNVDIVAEWVLQNNEFEETVNLEASKGIFTEKKGDWICVYQSIGMYYQFDEEKRDFSDICMFAYNEKENKVRYIFSKCYGSDANGPYYLSLDW